MRNRIKESPDSVITAIEAYGLKVQVRCNILGCVLFVFSPPEMPYMRARELVKESRWLILYQAKLDALAGVV